MWTVVQLAGSRATLAFLTRSRRCIGFKKIYRWSVFLSFWWRWWKSFCHCSSLLGHGTSMMEDDKDDDQRYYIKPSAVIRTLEATATLWQCWVMERELRVFTTSWPPMLFLMVIMTMTMMMMMGIILMLFILFTAATEHHLTLFCHTLPCLAIPARTLKGYTSQDFERIYQPGHWKDIPDRFFERIYQPGYWQVSVFKKHFCVLCKFLCKERSSGTMYWRWTIMHFVQCFIKV